MNAEPRVIVVDDEPHIRDLVQEYLTAFSYQARSAGSGAELDRMLEQQRPDLVILDVNMPGEDGFAILRRLRQADQRIGVIMLTAASAPDDRVSGLRGGADDYLCKPFEPRELLARVRTVLERIAAATPAAAPESRPAARFGPYALDLDGRRLLDRDGGELALTAMEFDLVCTFARNPNRVMDRSRLAALAHSRDGARDDRSVDVRIARLRQKLEAGAGGVRLIRTIRGEGYVYDSAAAKP